MYINYVMCDILCLRFWIWIIMALVVLGFSYKGRGGFTTRGGAGMALHYVASILLPFV